MSDTERETANSGPDGSALNARCASLIGDIQRGEETALTALYDLTLGKTYSLALRVTGSASDAEDVVAETYLQVWQNAARFDPQRGTPLAWLQNICRSRAIDLLRRRPRAMSHPDPDSLRSENSDDTASMDNDAALLVISDEREYAALKQAVQQLPVLSRQLLEFAFFRGLTHQEIADHTNTPLGTVKSRIRSALRALHEALADREVATVIDEPS